MLNDGILDTLGRPGQVQIMMNEKKKSLLLRTCDIDSEWAVVLPDEHVMQVEIGAKTLLRRIRRIVGWETEQPRICIGRPVLDNAGVCFDLAEAITVDVPDHGSEVI